MFKITKDSVKAWVSHETLHSLEEGYHKMQVYFYVIYISTPCRSLESLPLGISEKAVKPQSSTLTEVI